MGAGGVHPYGSPTVSLHIKQAATHSERTAAALRDRTDLTPTADTRPDRPGKDNR